MRIVEFENCFFLLFMVLNIQIGLLGGRTLTSTSVIAHKIAEIKNKLQLFLLSVNAIVY